jgi:hypothetical protein
VSHHPRVGSWTCDELPPNGCVVWTDEQKKKKKRVYRDPQFHRFMDANLKPTSFFTAEAPSVTACKEGQTSCFQCEELVHCVFRKESVNHGTVARGQTSNTQPLPTLVPTTASVGTLRYHKRDFDDPVMAIRFVLYVLVINIVCKICFYFFNMLTVILIH